MKAFIEDLYGVMTVSDLAGITSPAGNFAYQYVSGPLNLVSGISLPNGSVITNSFDANGRLTETRLMNSFGGTSDDYVYSYNQASQRTNCVRGGGIPNFVNYTYDPIGEVTSDLAYESINNASRLNEQLHYLYDAAGNLTYRTNNALVQNFQVNSLNELTTNTNGGTLTVMGMTTPIATNVTVNGSNAVLYGDYTFAAPNMPLATNYTALALGDGLAATNAVAFNLVSNAIFQYDGNGNLTNDGWRSFVYDDENQLIQVSVPTQWMSQFVYDGKMRRRARTEFRYQNGTWVQTNQVRYVYDGNLVVQERTTNNQPLVTYTRGRDLSGSLEGAGGIGGLLARTDTNGSTYYHADGNGNITILINSFQAVVAKYLYDAFGNILSKSGPLADGNLYRFSSKEAHPNSGLVYYLYRYYDPNLQRWPNTDPIGELGGRNLYVALRNNALQSIDPLGLTIVFDSSGSTRFKTYYNKCLCYLAQHSQNGAHLVHVASSSTTTITISPSDDGAYSGGGIGNPMNYVYPPAIFLYDTSKTGISPANYRELKQYGDNEAPPNNIKGCAVVLAHELGHVLYDLGDDVEVIRDVENPVRKDLNLLLRTQYHGMPIDLFEEGF
jgi:RHS repeat-associated protein